LGRPGERKSKSANFHSTWFVAHIKEERKIRRRFIQVAVGNPGKRKKDPQKRGGNKRSENPFSSTKLWKSHNTVGKGRSIS